MKPITEQNKALWLGGLPHTGSRPIAAEERAQLHAIANHSLRTFIIALAATPAAFLMLLILDAIFGAEGFPFFEAAMLIVMLVPAFAVVIMRDAWRRRKRILGDLDEGVLLVFEQESKEAGVSATQVEVLPISQMAWTVDGTRSKRWISAVPQEVSATPEYAEIAAEWVRPIDEDDESSPQANDREMSPAELAELASHIRRLRWTGFLSLAVINVLLAVVGWYSISLHRWPDSVMFYLLVVIVPVGDWAKIKAWLFAAGLAKDAAVGRILIIRVNVEEEGASRLSDAYEYLPVTRTLWSIAGDPIRWRLSPAARRGKR